MALTMKERHSVVKELSRGYLRSRKKNRGHILDELVSLTGYNRDYAALLLRGYAHGTVYGAEGVLMKPSVSRTRRRSRIYGEDVHKGLKKIWAIYDCHCGKYMAPGLEEMIRVLERDKEIKLTDDVRQKLLRISPVTSISGAVGETGKRPEPFRTQTVLFMTIKVMCSASLLIMQIRKPWHAGDSRKIVMH